MRRLVRVWPSRACAASLLALALIVSGCGGGGGSDDWYYHWNCNGDPDCLATNPTGQPSGTLNEGPEKVNCTQLLQFAAHFWGPAATNSCDQSPAGGGNSPLVSIAVTPANPRIAKGLSQSFKATGTFADGTSKDISGQVTWSVGTPAVAHMLNQLATGDAPGATSIVATSGSISGSTTLTVTAATLQTITVAPTPVTIVNGATQQFTATGHFSDGASPDLTGLVSWSSTPTGIAAVSPGGLASSLAPGTASVIATSGAVSGRATLHVTAAVLQSISIVPANGQVPKGLHQQLIANGSYSDGTTVDLSAQVSWVSDTPDVATVAPGGLAAAVGLGTTNVTATLGSVSRSTTLTVIAAVLSSISVAPPQPTLPSGLSRAFTATGHYSDGTTQDLTASATWTSDTTSVATIAVDGTATTKSPGTSSIAAALGGVSGSTVLTVSAATLVSIAVTPVNPSITTGTELQFSAVGTYSDATTFDLMAFVTWGSGTPAAATISAGGRAFGVAAGSSLISATQGTISGSSTLSVFAPGEIWTTRASAPALGVPLFGVAASSDEVVAVGKVTIVASPDGLAWTSHTAAGILNGVTWTGAMFAAVGWFENTLTNLAQTSSDGATWSTATWTTSSLQPLFGVAWSGSRFAAVGFGGGVFTSPDASTWTAQPSGTGAWLHRAAWSGALFVAVGDGGTILTSPDGLTWAARTSGTPNALNGIVWDGARFLAVGGGGTILTSPDGITWTPRTSSTANALNGVASSGAGYVAVGDGGAVVTSPDGTTWSAATSGTSLTLNDVTWFGTRFVAVGGITNGIILTSP